MRQNPTIDPFACDRRGAGPPLILLPGLFAGSWIWERTRARLTGGGRATVAGCHPYALYDRAQTTLVALTRHLGDFLDRHQIASATLLANSFGGLVALAFARRHPERVNALVLSGTPGLGDETNLGVGAPRKLTRDYAFQLADHLFYDRATITDAMVDATFAAVTQPGARRNIVRLLRVARTARLEQWLGEVNVPTLLLWGAEDRVTPVAPWRTVAGRLPAARLVTVARCGHSPIVERPDDFCSLVAPFLDRVAPVGAAACGCA